MTSTFASLRVATSYFQPRSKDSDLAYREATIRRVIVPMIVLILISLPSTFFFNEPGWPLLSFKTMLTLSGLLVLGVFIAIHQEKILAAAYLLTAAFIIVPVSLILIGSYSGILILPAVMLALLISVLALPRQALWSVGLECYGVVAAAILYDGTLHGTSGTYTVIQTLITLFILCVAELVILSNIQAEFARRLEAMRIANEQAEAARKEAEAANKAKSQFLANTSHELRTPLNAIIGYTEIILAGMTGEVPPKQRELQGHVHENSKRLLGLINDVLDLARMEAGVTEVVATPADPKDVIKGAADAIRSLAEKKGLELRFEMGESVPVAVVCDIRKVQQAITNLVGNSIKFTEKGHVTIRLEAGATADDWEIQVQDTGIGMPDDAATYIFEMFRQVEGSDRRQYGGTGLGLTITKNMIELMGGHISLKTKLGVGTTFIVTLPRIYHKPGKMDEIEQPYPPIPATSAPVLAATHH